MVKTSLPFYRKNQVLEDLEHERPKSMTALREALLGATGEVRKPKKTTYAKYF